MRKDKRDIFLEDLSARTNFGVKVQVKGQIVPYTVVGISNISDECPVVECASGHAVYYIPYDDVRPYLRRMSSMTEEERIEFEKLGWRVDELDDNKPWASNGSISSVVKGIKWLCSHHFDFNGLIDLKLAKPVNKKNDPYRTRFCMDCMYFGVYECSWGCAKDKWEDGNCDPYDEACADFK